MGAVGREGGEERGGRQVSRAAWEPGTVRALSSAPAARSSDRDLSGGLGSAEVIDDLDKSGSHRLAQAKPGKEGT